MIISLSVITCVIEMYTLPSVLTAPRTDILGFTLLSSRELVDPCCHHLNFRWLVSEIQLSSIFRIFFPESSSSSIFRQNYCLSTSDLSEFALTDIFFVFLYFAPSLSFNTFLTVLACTLIFCSYWIKLLICAA